jgi:hypothetical protein
MPHLGEYKSILDSVFFLYETAKDAERGEKLGATGFLVTFPSVRFPGAFWHYYAVTNWHAACRDGCSIIRFNTTDGRTDIIQLSPKDWHFIPGKYDIAAAPLTEPNRQNRHQTKYLHHDYFLLDSEEQQMDVGVGDDVFMIGRFVDYDGVQTNQPTVRFGNISIANAAIKQPTGTAVAPS